MRAEKENYSNKTAAVLGGRLLTISLVVLGLLAWSMPVFAPAQGLVVDSVAAAQIHFDHGVQLSDTELGEFPELDLEDDDKKLGEYTRTPQRVAGQKLQGHKRLVQAETRVLWSGHHNTRGARSPPLSA